MDGKKIEVVKLIDTPKNVYTRMSTGYNEADRVLRGTDLLKVHLH